MVIWPPVITDRRIKFNLDKVSHPTTHDQIVTVVKEAYNNGHKVRVLAAGHSWSEIAQTQDIMISLHEYQNTLEDLQINQESNGYVATVKAGTQLKHLSNILDQKGLAMINLGSVAAQSLGGAISTGESLILHVTLAIVS